MVELETEQLTDDALVARFRRGDGDAFARLYQRHRQGLYGYALSFYGQEAPAADAVQELWLGFLADVENLAGVANVRAYLYRSLRNRVLDEFRRQKRERGARAQNTPATLAKPRGTVASRGDAGNRNQAPARPPEAQRAVAPLRISGEVSSAARADA